MQREPQKEEVALRTLAEGRAVLEAGSRGLARLAGQLDDSFVQAVDAILGSSGKLVLTGIGKAGKIASKISATFASTGTPSIYLHPTDALHGDLGRVDPQDIVLALSNSGGSDEVARLIQPLRSIGARLLAITAVKESTLGRAADICLCFGRQAEAGHLGLAPTTSTTCMLALGDALAMAVLSRRQLSPAEFARFHPGGALGRSLMRVEEVMRRGERNPVAGQEEPLIRIVQRMTSTEGRPGAISLVDEDGILAGFYTDGDFRRDMEQIVRDDATTDARALFQQPVSRFMTANPRTIRADQLVAEAVRLLSEMKIDQVPVIDGDRRPIGLIDVQDLLDVRILG
ncbi:MAG: KpsF/GutQ family sugar-phosphate isomerase [Planctomycetota bacterium]